MDSRYIPTFVRYTLLIIGTRLASGGWLPYSVAHELPTDPLVVEFATGVALGLIALISYWRSRAKAALDSWSS